MRRFGFILTILLTSFSVLGQRTIEVSLTDLERINSDFGLDSLEKVVRGIPIWTLDTATSISILKSINSTKDRYSWGHRFTREFGLAVKSKTIDSKLKLLLKAEIENIKGTDIVKKKFQSPSDEVLMGLLFQNSNNLKQILEEHLIELDVISEKINSAQPKSKLKYFFKGWPPVVWNKYELNLSQFKLLSCLNRLYPTKYQDKLLDEKRKGLHSMKEDYNLEEFARSNCYNYRETKIEETEINGIKVPKEILSTNELPEKCWLFKIKKDENNYIIEKGCSFDPLAGHGETLMITKDREKFKICVLESWIS
jgi:hypothetical protein